nr:hypothetical protein [Tanacetum cinerariifolium]
PVGQRQPGGGAGGPAGQQVGHRPARSRHQADQGKAQQREIQHAGYHRQHGPQRADEASHQQAGNAIALKIAFGGADPLWVRAQ